MNTVIADLATVTNTLPYTMAIYTRVLASALSLGVPNHRAASEQALAFMRAEDPTVSGFEFLRNGQVMLYFVSDAAAIRWKLTNG